MKIIIPMAGMGKRMRPHTLTVPKPLIPLAGKPIVQHLVEDLAQMCAEQIDEIAFVIGRFGEATEKMLIQIAESQGAKGTICYQDEALGTAHAVLCAKEQLEGKVIVAFADTLFRANFTIDEAKDGILYVQQIPDPSAFGVVKLNDNGQIVDFVEKSKEFVSDLAMIGCYYFKQGELLRRECEYLIDNNIMKSGEYQLPDAMRRLVDQGFGIYPGQVDEWLDCGNKAVTVYTNQRVLENKKASFAALKPAENTNSIVIQPCFIGENVVLRNSIVGPHVSLGANTIVENSVVSNSIVQTNSTLRNVNVSNSMIGNYVTLAHQPQNLNLGDYSASE